MCDKNCKGKDITEIVDLEMNSVLKFMLQESKKQKKALIVTVWLLVLCFVGTVIYYEYSFKAFLSQYNINSNVVTQTVDTEGNGNITDVNKYTKNEK